MTEPTQEQRAGWKQRIARIRAETEKGEWIAAEFTASEFAALLAAYEDLKAQCARWGVDHD